MTATDAERVVAAAPQASAVPSQGIALAAVAIVVGGILYAVGSALPWISISAAFIGTVTRSGLEGGDGVITLIIGLVIAFVGLARVTNSNRAGSKAATVILALVASGFAVWEISNVNERIADLDTEVTSIASVGIGLWMMAVGGVVAALGAFNLRR